MKKIDRDNASAVSGCEANMAGAVVRIIGYRAPPGIAHAGDFGARLEAKACKGKRSEG